MQNKRFLSSCHGIRPIRLLLRRLDNCRPTVSALWSVSIIRMVGHGAYMKIPTRCYYLFKQWITTRVDSPDRSPYVGQTLPTLNKQGNMALLNSVGEKMYISISCIFPRVNCRCANALTYVFLRTNAIHSQPSIPSCLFLRSLEDAERV